VLVSDLYDDNSNVAFSEDDCFNRLQNIATELTCDVLKCNDNIFKRTISLYYADENQKSGYSILTAPELSNLLEYYFSESTHEIFISYGLIDVHMAGALFLSLTGADVACEKITGTEQLKIKLFE
jgi:hypothetical protein